MFREAMKFKTLKDLTTRGVVASTVVAVVTLAAFLAGNMFKSPGVLKTAMAIGCAGAVLYTSFGILVLLDHPLAVLSSKWTGSRTRPKRVMPRKQFRIHFFEWLMFMAVTLSSPGATKVFLYLTPRATIVFGAIYWVAWALGKRFTSKA